MSAVARVAVELDAKSALAGMRRLENRAAATSDKFNSLQRVATRLAGAFAGIQAAKFVFVKTAELEKQTKSLEVLTGSLENAGGIIEELQDFGAVTPFTSAELIETAKRLKAFGFETEDLVDITKRLGDVAGATGADLGGIATAFGQIQAKGRLQGEELLQLQERGIRLQDELQKMYGFTADEFRKALEGGRISADAVNRALENITNTGGKYAGGAIAQSETLNGKLSTLTDSVDTLARAFGTILAPAIKKTFDFAIQALGAINDLIEVQLLSGQLGVSISPETQRSLEATAEQIAILRTGETGLIKSMKFSEEYNNVLRQLEKSELKRQGFEMGLLKVPDAFKKASDANELPDLLGGNNGKTEAEIIEDQRKASLDRIQALKDQASLAAALNDEEKRSVQLNIDLRKILENTVGLEKEEVKAEIDARLALEDKVLASIKYEESQKRAKDLAKQAADEAAKQAEKLKQQYAEIANTIRDGLVDGIMAAVDGSRSLAESLSGVLKQLAGIFLQRGIGNFASQGGGGLLGLIPGLANGGPASRGRPYVVGERGPELFVPNSSGTVVPNGAIGGANVVVNVDASGTEVQGSQGNADQLGRLIGQAVQAELIKQKRPGGLLTR
tara:strand:- start:2124 stop:3980 length:1857 start_codon:yes stop_codon:yes gene_type:complete